MKRPRVILRRCELPEPDRVRGVVAECFEELGFRARGRTLIKPNVVTANRGYIHHSYTHPGVIEGLVGAVRGSAEVGEITIGESSGFGIPPGLFFHEAGYDALAKRLGVRLVDFNEDRSRWVDLKRAFWQKGFNVAESILGAETKIWAPKLKYHICCQVTNALKLNVGILQHRDRLAFHDDRLNDKIVDLLEVGFPDLVVSDGTVVGHGYESAPRGLALGLILVSDHPLAADAVAGVALGYRPEEIDHLRIASERGYGSIRLEDFDISGDFPLDEIRERTRGVVSEYQDIHAVDTPLKFYCGDAPEREQFCYGGCLAAVKGCLGTTDKRKPGSVKGARPGAVVTGIYRGDVLHPNDTVMLIGDCTRVDGKLEAKRVTRIKGCPCGTAHLLLKLPLTFGMPTPMADARSAGLFIKYGMRSALRKAAGAFRK